MTNKKGFTLIEMLIIVVIIGLLSAALIPRLIWAQSQARDVVRKKHISDISTALEQYYNNLGKYPWYWDLKNFWIEFLWCTNQLLPILSWYISNIPNDPQKNKVHYWTEMYVDWNGNPKSWWSLTTGCLASQYIYKDLAAYDYNWTSIPTSDRWKSYVLAANMENMKNNNLMFFGLTPLNRSWGTEIENFYWHINSKSYYQNKFFCWEWKIKIDPVESKCQWPDIKKANYAFFSIN